MVCHSNFFFKLTLFCLDFKFAHCSAYSATGTLCNNNFSVHIDKLEFKRRTSGIDNKNFHLKDLRKNKS